MATQPILTTLNGGVRIIKFNRPTRKNALALKMYREITNILISDATNDAVVLTVFTGEGDYYSSGHDLSPRDNNNESPIERANLMRVTINNLIKTLIDYPKLLVAVVNGPALGFAVTSLALLDIVYVSDRATFATPFVHLGIVPEGCSSYLFPRLMGRSKASEMLLLGKKITSYQAVSCNLASEVVPHEQLPQLFQRLQDYGKQLPVSSVKNAKSLIVSCIKDTLHKVNVCECDALKDCFMSDEFKNAMANFSARKSKL